LLVWIAGWLYNAARAPRTRTRGRYGSPTVIIGAVLVIAVVVTLDRFYGRYLVVGTFWLRITGFAVLVVSTVFTVWARLSLGTMWSISARAKDQHQLRTGGPYAVTRHPIYTGLLGMLLGTTLLNGIGHSVVLFPIGLVLLTIKARSEERLMLATFPDQYPRYRRRVPQLIPGLRLGGAGER
jgi:protein-S-isoprenylcysteine O-methyltransferase Ste14